MKILMVCLGNICRSPMAEGIMQSMFEKYKINGVVDSAGVIGFHTGENPDKRAIETSLKHNIDISRQKARQFQEKDLEKFDFIFTMDQSIYDAILKSSANHINKNRIHNFLTFAGNSHSKNVPDPYYGDLKEFESVFALIETHCEIIAQKIRMPHE